MRRRRPTIVVSVTAGAALALLAAGCGGDGGSPGVASVASSTTTATTSTTTESAPGSAEKAPSGSGGGQGQQFQLGMNVGTVAGGKFSACMRKHGVTSFPDPNGQGVITIHSGMGIDPGSPAFRSARAFCEKVLPNGGQPTAGQIAEQQQQMLALSACMRAHGLKDFPDPSNGGLRIQVHPGSDLDPNNPTFRRARQACQKYQPFKGGSLKGGSG